MGPDHATRLADAFEAHVGALLLYARQLLPGGGQAAAGAAAAEDVVQEAFVALLGQPAMPASPKAWLFAAVRNAAASALRQSSRRRRREQAVAEAHVEWFEPEAPPGDLIDARAARAALESLPEPQREVVVLRIWGGLTLAEAAAATGMPVSTVHDHYRRALAAVRKVLEERRCPTATRCATR